MKIRDADGNVHDCPHGIDVNVWDSELYGDRPIKGIAVSVYRMNLTPDGLNDTDVTNGCLFTLDTDLPTEEWDEDDWFGFNDDTAPGDFPHQILAILQPYMVD